MIQPRFCVLKVLRNMRKCAQKIRILSETVLKIPSENDELSLKIQEISLEKLYFQRVIYDRIFVGFG